MFLYACIILYDVMLYKIISYYIVYIYMLNLRGEGNSCHINSANQSFPEVKCNFLAVNNLPFGRPSRGNICVDELGTKNLEPIKNQRNVGK